MQHTVKLPKLGDAATEVVVIEWIASIGDEVAAGDPLLTVETDKVQAEVPSPLAGRLVEQLVQPEDESRVGDPLAVLETD